MDVIEGLLRANLSFLTISPSWSKGIEEKTTKADGGLDVEGSFYSAESITYYGIRHKFR